MRIRKAIAEESVALTQVAHDAKRHWGYPDHWIKHWQGDLTLSPEYIASNPVFLAEKDQQILGFYALIVRQDQAELDHLWVAPQHIGAGVGKALFFHAMENAAKSKISKIEILADPNAEGFYRKMGAHRIGETTSEMDGEPRTLPLLTIKPSIS